MDRNTNDDQPIAMNSSASNYYVTVSNEAKLLLDMLLPIISMFHTSAP